MLKKCTIPILLLFLFTFVLISPLKVYSCTIPRQVILLDCPGLELLKITNKYPNLSKLLSTSTVTLVTAPNSPKNVLDLIPLKKSMNTFNSTVIMTREHFSFPDILDSSPKCPPLYNHLNNSILIPNSYPLGSLQNKVTIFRWDSHESLQPNLTDDFHKRILRYYDNLTGYIFDKINSNHTLLLVCAYNPQKPAVQNKNLFAVILRGPNYTNGTLYSQNTRKPGIITCADLRNIILNPDINTGTPGKIKIIPGKWRSIAVQQPALIKNYSIRWPLLTILGYLTIGLVFAFILGLIRHFPKPILIVLIWIYLYVLTIPGTFLIEATLAPTAWTSIITYTLVIGGGILIISYVLSGKSMNRTLMWLAFLTTGLCVIDTLRNGYFESKSFLGYSILAGGRYYGTGNEYMGIFLGAYIVGVTLSLHYFQKWRKQILWGATIFLSLILFFPLFGSDVGGGITALMGLGITNYLWLNQPIRFKNIAGLCLLTLLIFTGMAFLDRYVYGSSMSHLGSMVLAIQKNGIGVFVDLVIRKMTMNLHLIRTSPLTLILLGFLISIPFLYRYPSLAIKKLITRYPEITSGCVGLSITAFIGFFTNDSGIISAAMSFLFGISLLIPIIIPEHFNP